MYYYYRSFMFCMYSVHRDLHVLTHSFPTRRSSALQEQRRQEVNRIAGDRFECPPTLLPERVGFDPAEVHEISQCSALLERLSLDRERLGPVNLVAERELVEIEESRSEEHTLNSSH